jgi:CDP-diglyceride synthetase
MLIDILPVWILFFVTIALVVLSAEIGYRIGQAIRGKTERESPASSISSVILGLQAFMLAFTFGIVSNRYDNKRTLVRDEANVIRTAWYRSDFLLEPDRAKAKGLLQEYVDKRIEFAETRDLGLVKNALDDAGRMQQQLWEVAVSNGRRDMSSNIAALYVQSINQITNLHAERVSIGLNSRIPTTLWIVLLSLLTLGMICLGYYTSVADSRRSRATPMLAIAFSLVIALIAALDRPGSSLMPISQQPLLDLQSEMETLPGSAR